MQNDEGQNMDLYIPRKCSATNRLITSKDHASVQINVGHLNENGVYDGKEMQTVVLIGSGRKRKLKPANSDVFCPPPLSLSVTFQSAVIVLPKLMTKPLGVEKQFFTSNSSNNIQESTKLQAEKAWPPLSPTILRILGNRSNPFAANTSSSGGVRDHHQKLSAMQIVAAAEKVSNQQYDRAIRFVSLHWLAGSKGQRSTLRMLFRPGLSDKRVALVMKMMGTV
nr:40S ribosomal protein S21-like [Ipomoea batatas]